METINRFMKNHEIIERDEVKYFFEEGYLIVIDVVETNNPEYINLYLLGNVDFGKGGSLSKAEAQLAGINLERPMRCIALAKADIAEAYRPGDIMPKEFTIRVEDSYEKSFDSQPPRTTVDGEILVGDDNKIIYRNTRVVTREELEENPHNIIKTKGTLSESPDGDKEPITEEMLIN